MDITIIYIYLWLMKYPTDSSDFLQNHPRRRPVLTSVDGCDFGAYLMKSHDIPIKPALNHNEIIMKYP